MGGDSIYGEVKKQSEEKFYESCTFKNGDMISHFTPNLIQAYGFIGGASYVSGIIKNSFVEILLKGHLSLYKKRHTFYLKDAKDGITVLRSGKEAKKIDGKVFSDQDNKWRGLLIAKTSDCMRGHHVVQELVLDEKKLVNYLSDYHKCINQPYGSYKTEKKWFELDWGFTSGYAIKYIYGPKTYQNYYLHKKYRSGSPVYGLIFTLSSLRRSQRLFFETSLLYHRAKYSYTEFIPSTSNVFTISYTAEFDLQTLTVPFALKYFFIETNSIDAGFRGGIELDFHLKKEFSMIRTQERTSDPSNSNVQVMSPFDLENQVGSFIGFDIERPIGQMKVGFTVTYTYLLALKLAPVNIDTGRFAGRVSLTF